MRKRRQGGGRSGAGRLTPRTRRFEFRRWGQFEVDAAADSIVFTSDQLERLNALPPLTASPRDTMRNLAELADFPRTEGAARPTGG